MRKILVYNNKYRIKFSKAQDFLLISGYEIEARKRIELLFQDLQSYTLPFMLSNLCLSLLRCDLNIKH